MHEFTDKIARRRFVGGSCGPWPQLFADPWTTCLPDYWFFSFWFLGGRKLTQLILSSFYTMLITKISTHGNQFSIKKLVQRSSRQSDSMTHISITSEHEHPAYSSCMCCGASELHKSVVWLLIFFLAVLSTVILSLSLSSRSGGRVTAPNFSRNLHRHLELLW